ncbi:hypothetical protein M3I54_27890 [Paraburkholderia sp. CNPSo 3274]|uniref:hypothetical protein n=1 Tax=Paraburkholderia sp. CNPSo 3274 TaxID=2940932 RepID=UPI0020B73E7B|nr:hypothetical protein [Paraburkholderia sp. CNPSo 3274]MCP3710749.1 hypothetical protein [Paraburkholderia sp. CNPSo 3274]
MKKTKTPRTTLAPGLAKVCFPAVLLSCVVNNTDHIDIFRIDTLTATEPVLERVGTA